MRKKSQPIILKPPVQLGLPISQESKVTGLDIALYDERGYNY